MLAQDLGAKTFGAETCKLGATNDDAEIRVEILKEYLQGYICEKLSKKGSKNKKFRKGVARLRWPQSCMVVLQFLYPSSN